MQVLVLAMQLSPQALPVVQILQQVRAGGAAGGAAMGGGEVAVGNNGVAVGGGMGVSVGRSGGRAVRSPATCTLPASVQPLSWSLAILSQAPSWVRATARIGSPRFAVQMIA